MQPFATQQVRWLPGPFREAMGLDRKSLLALHTDRLRHTFRANAGLPASAKPLGG
ncbi:MAG TPA: beta-L-arabinofuranosidase domain-containing protein [Gemmataceae bacterium]|nr:beta-L-arabinofuranosidase domain-containing protein [Gemmataceae bacterium]